MPSVAGVTVPSTTQSSTGAAHETVASRRDREDVDGREHAARAIAPAVRRRGRCAERSARRTGRAVAPSRWRSSSASGAEHPDQPAARVRRFGRDSGVQADAKALADEPVDTPSWTSHSETSAGRARSRHFVVAEADRELSRVRPAPSASPSAAGSMQIGAGRRSRGRGGRSRPRDGRCPPSGEHDPEPAQDAAPEGQPVDAAGAADEVRLFDLEVTRFSSLP